ncbi:MAG: dockerin type I repeat-containing protein, partial [Lachnospira sp.]|nr:dockerin type I repeat-containing protein [Lachnospira sp.]
TEPLYSTVWYKVNADMTVDRSEELEYLPTTGSESLTIIREISHKCDSVINGAGTCNMCGVKVLYGDNDSDGKVSINDAVMLKKYLAGDTTPGINLGAANVNVDKKVSVEDAVKLMQHLAGMDVKLGVAE